MSLAFPSRSFDDAVAAVCHGTASDEQVRALNALLRQDPAARDGYLVRVELHARLASDPDLFAPVAFPEDSAVLSEVPRECGHAIPSRSGSGLGADRGWRRRTGILVLAACLGVSAVLAWWPGRGVVSTREGTTSRAVAMLNRVVDAQWSADGIQPRVGAPIEPGWLRLESGLAQIVFHQGARVVLEGPAEFGLVSPVEAACTGGRLIVEVPPQARGFRVVTPGLGVTDLGTAFGLVVTGHRTELHVFEGSVAVQSGRPAGLCSVGEGQGVIAEGTESPRRVDMDPSGFATLFELQTRSVAAEALRHDQWREAHRRWRQDPLLWVHFDFEQGASSDWRLRNTGGLAGEIPDATIVGCRWTEGRWSTKAALEFRNVSDRVRLEVPGPLESVTLAAWVRVQGLDRRINALFMSDGFRPETLHWLIRNDGVLGLTVIGPRPGDHQILASPPVLTLDQMGIWTHLAVVLDGPAGQVVHYLNGAPVSRHALRFGPPFRIGAAELGNWNRAGFPGDDPFLIRNFSGVMDEFSLFARPLGAGEIRELHADGRPQARARLAAGP